MNVELKPLSSITPYARNPRKNAAAVATVKASLKEYGWQQPIVVDPEGVIIVGHTRYAAALELGWKDAPVHVAGDLTPAQIKAYRLMDNKSHERAEWDMELLALELEDLKGLEFDLELTGFELEELAGLALAAGGETTSGDTEPQIDRAEELRAQWGVETGQLWQLGDHRLLCGDSTKAEDVARVMHGEKADLLLTDPPYGMRLDTDFSKMPRGENKYSRVIGDEKDFDFSIILKIWEAPLMAVWGGGWFYNTLPAGGSWVIWDKQPQHTVAGPQNHFEECWIYPHKKRIIIRRLWTGFTAKEAGQSRIHPTQKPVSVMEDIGRFMGGWGVCADPFSGSGTTIIAGDNLGRKVRAIEISPGYVAVALQRWADHTGKTPLLLPA